ncbi:MAG: cyclic nucleotide-binding domain-containing protein [Desulfobacterales bacterium]
MNQSDIEIILGECEFFKYLKKEAIGKIVSLCKLKTYEVGDYVFQQGDFGDYLYIIADGQVFLERLLDMGSRKGNVVIETLGKGRVFGCWSTLLSDPHFLMSSACCQKPTKVLCLKGTDLRDIMTKDREIGFHILERLCFLLRDRIQSAYGALEKI